MILYGAWRFAIEFFRNDERGFVGALSTSQFISIFAVCGRHSAADSCDEKGDSVAAHSGTGSKKKSRKREKKRRNPNLGKKNNETKKRTAERRFVFI
jgi:hypothetical protein